MTIQGLVYELLAICSSLTSVSPARRTRNLSSGVLRKLGVCDDGSPIGERRPSSWIGRGAVPLGLLAVPPATTGLIPLFLSFLKIGSVLFGSGYVLLAFLRSEFVGPGMLTQRQLVDAVAVGQITPGPVFTTATFIGYLLEGVPGAIVATVGIFLPAFVFVILTGPIIPRLRSSPIMSSFLDGVNAVSLALMAGVTWYLGRTAVVDPFTAVLAVVAFVLSYRFKINPAWLVLGGGSLGFAYQYLLG
jgi:chromate transporter